MTDIYLRQGYASPNDITLRDPTVFVPLVQTIIILQALETELARVLAWSPKKRLVVQAIETDGTQAFGKRKLVAVIQSTETELTRIIRILKAVLTGQSTEADSVGVIAKKKEKSVGQSVEQQLARILSKYKIKGVSRTNETDATGRTILRLKALSLDVKEALTVVPEIFNLEAEAETEVALVVEPQVVDFEAEPVDNDLIAEPQFFEFEV